MAPLTVRLRGAPGAHDASVVSLDLARSVENVSLSTTTTLSGVQDTRLLPSAVASTTATSGYWLTPPVVFRVQSPPYALLTATKTVANETYQPVALDLGDGSLVNVPSQSKATLGWRGARGRWEVVANGQPLNVMPPANIATLPGYSASASSSNAAANGPSTAFDIASNTWWITPTTAAGSFYASNYSGLYFGTVGTLATDGVTYAGEWIQFNAPAAFSISGYRLSRGAFTIGTPVSWFLFGAPSINGPWKRLHTVYNSRLPGYYRSVAYTLSPPTEAFKSYRLAFSRAYADTRTPYISIEDIAFYPTSSPTQALAGPLARLRGRTRPTVTVSSNPFMSSDCVALFSTRLLNRSYAGPVATISRSTDNAATDVFSNKHGVLSTPTGCNLSLWLGGASARVRALYDQGPGRFVASSASNYMNVSDVALVPRPSSNFNSDWVLGCKRNAGLSMPAFNVHSTSNLSFFARTAIQSPSVEGHLGTAQQYVLRYRSAVYPPDSLTDFTTVIAGQPYGNGQYQVSCSEAENSIAERKSWTLFRNNSAAATTGFHSSTSVFTGSYTGAATTLIGGTAVAGLWIQITLPAAIVLRSFGIVPRPTYAQRTPNTFYVVGSNDGTSWTTVAYYAGFTDSMYAPAPAETVFDASANKTAYRYFRLVVQSLNTGVVSPLNIFNWALYSGPADQHIGYFTNLNTYAVGFGSSSNNVATQHYAQHWVPASNADVTSIVYNVTNNAAVSATTFGAYVDDLSTTRVATGAAALSLQNDQAVSVGGFDGHMQTLAVFSAWPTAAAQTLLHQMHLKL